MSMPTCPNKRRSARGDRPAGPRPVSYRPANDNAPSAPADWAPGLTAALRHFERHGLASERKAQLAWNKAEAAGDLSGLAYWASIRRTFGWNLERRLGETQPSRAR